MRFRANTVLRLFVLRLPCGEACKGFIRAVVIANAFVQLCDFRHLVVCQLEVENVEVIPDVIHVLASRYDDKAHLCVPAEDDLRRGICRIFHPAGQKPALQ